MSLLLTILSILAAWALLMVLAIGLLLILKPLQSVRAHLEKIAMGVRAIERETAPLDEHVQAATASFDGTAGAASAAARRLSDVVPSVDGAVPTLSSQS